MTKINLNNKLTLFIEALDKRIRLIVSEADVELACRKETIKKLNQFLTTDDSHLFKGRLQLTKKGELVKVILKNETIGAFSSNQLMEALI